MNAGPSLHSQSKKTVPFVLAALPMAAQTIADLIPTLALDEIGHIEMLHQQRKDELQEAGAASATGSMKQVRSLQNKAQYQQRKRRQAEQALQETLPQKEHFRIAAVWYVRAALARPNLPVSALVELITDFSLDAQASIAETSVRKAKDAFCGMILEFNRENICRNMQSLASEQHGNVFRNEILTYRAHLL